jgi:molecular chaperone GrpE
METNEKDTNQGLLESSELSTCKQELADITQKYLYAHAEFENYKKRTSKELASSLESSQDRIISDVLSLIDDLERVYTEVHSDKLPQDNAAHIAAIAMIVKNSQAFLKKYAIEEISQDRPFDPHFFEAVMQQNSSDHASGSIVMVLQKGYIRNGRVLRPAKVIVAG